MPEYRYFGDSFNPQEHALRKQQQQMNELKIQQAQQGQQQTQKFNQYLSGENQQTLPDLIAGKKKLTSIGQMTDKLFTSKNIDGNRINKTNELMQRDPDVQAAIKQGGYDSIQFNYNEDKKQASQMYTKDYTREELDEMSRLPGGGFLTGLAPGKHTINFDPIRGTIRPVTSPHDLKKNIGDIMSDKTFTEKDAIKYATFGTPEQVKQAEKFLDRNLKYEKRKNIIKYGELSSEAIEFYAEKVMIDPSYISRFSARTPQRAAIANRVEQLTAERGFKNYDLTLQNVQMNAAIRSYNKQKSAYDAAVKTSDEFMNDSERVLEMLSKIRTNRPAWANKSMIQLKKIAADPSLGEEGAILNELFALNSAFMRTATDTSESISELSAGMQKMQAEMNDPYAPLFETAAKIRNQQDQVRDKMKSRKQSLNKNERGIERYATFEKKKKTKSDSNKNQYIKQFNYNDFEVEVIK